MRCSRCRLQQAMVTESRQHAAIIGGDAQVFRAPRPAAFAPRVMAGEGRPPQA